MDLLYLLLDRRKDVFFFDGENFCEIRCFFELFFYREWFWFWFGLFNIIFLLNMFMYFKIYCINLIVKKKGDNCSNNNSGLKE